MLAGVGVNNLRKFGFDLSLLVLNGRRQAGQLLSIVLAIQLNERLSQQHIAIHTWISRRVKERIERIKILLSDRIEFVIMTNRATAG